MIAHPKYDEARNRIAEAREKLIAEQARAIAEMLAALQVIRLNLSLAGRPSERELNHLHAVASAAIAKAAPSTPASTEIKTEGEP